MHILTKRWLQGLALCICLALCSFPLWQHYNKPVTEKTSYNATLVQAYEYGDRCGSKGRYECSAWKGRFQERITGFYFERDITGFFYQNFVEGGRKPIESYITLSKEAFGFKTPWYGDMFGGLLFLAIFGFFGMLITGVFLPTMIQEHNYEKKKKAEDDERKARFIKAGIW